MSVKTRFHKSGVHVVYRPSANPDGDRVGVVEAFFDAWLGVIPGHPYPSVQLFATREQAAAWIDEATA